MKVLKILAYSLFLEAILYINNHRNNILNSEEKLYYGSVRNLSISLLPLLNMISCITWIYTEEYMRILITHGDICNYFLSKNTNCNCIISVKNHRVFQIRYRLK